MKQPIVFSLCLLLLNLFSINLQGQSTGEKTLLLRMPTISESSVAFVYGGDIWIADKDGQNPRRVTINPGVESHPIFSPDGSRIAFTGNYDGNTDVYTVSIHGGEPQRITNHPTADILRGWIDNNSVYFTTTREFTYSLGSRLYQKSFDDKSSKPLSMPQATQGSPSKDGRYWAYIKNTDPTERDRVAFKRYRGGGMPSIWIFDTKTHEVDTIPGGACNDVKPLWINDKVYFLSDREKVVNIYSYDIKSKQVEKLTNFQDYDVRTLQGREGELVFEYKGGIHLLNLQTNQVKEIPVYIQADALYKRTKYVDMSRGIRSFSISPTGQRAVFEARGEIYTVPREKGDARNISNSPGTHERFPSWSPDGKWISYLSDKNGKYELVLRDQFAKKEPEYYSLGIQLFNFQPIWSPDSKKLFFNDAHLNLYYIDITTKDVVLVDTDDAASITGRTGNHFTPSWSPDSQWITYVKSLDNGVRTLFVYDLKSAKAHQVTDGMSAVSQPVFSRDGKFIFFSASTNTGLTNSGLHMSAYDRHPSYNVYAFILSKDTPSLFPFESDEEKVKEDATAKDEGEQKQDKKDGKEKDNSTKKKSDKKKSEKSEKEKSDKPSIKIDFDQVERRIVALPLPSGSYRLDGTVDGKLVYQRGSTLGAYNIKNQKDEKLADNIRTFTISADGKRMLYSSGRDFFIVPAGVKVSPNNGKINLSNIRQLVDPVAEWNQIFNEVWAMQKEFFYVENMHGADWDAIKEKYSKFLPYVSHRSDLGYLLNEMMGEMVVGHNYIYPGDEPSSPSVSTGVLGADLLQDKGYYKISKIYDTQNWNPSLYAPLAQPGMKAQEGNYIVGIDGQDLKHTENIYQLLEFKVDKQVVLHLNSKPEFGGSWEVTVKPISFGKEMGLRTMAWVEGNRKKVDRLSDGQIAYVYMPNTGREGYDYFNRYYFSQMDKKALLIDERNNGGGSVADYVIDLLSRELISGWGIRDGKPFTTPGNGIYGPKAMIINEDAGSGGDMMPYMFRFKGLGKLVGRTTMGILVGISGYPPLIDGGRITSPNFGVFDLNGNYIIENEGVAPDIFIEQTPKEILQGKDPQLEKTVEILLEEMKTYPYKTIKKPIDPVRVN
ncbi:MAG TPA: PDZ domain-containing protein [Candidatus Sphingobacterium stercoripullorum]|nr:PDZ domain-containing protein [Candidatus Sphingobacterium stercoripullorum]